MRFRLEGDDREYEFIKRLTFDEGELVEGILKRDIMGPAWGELGSITRQRILVFCSIRREIPTFSWADLGKVSIDDVEPILSEQERADIEALLAPAVEPVPTTAGAEAGPKPRKRAPAKRSPRSA